MKRILTLIFILFVCLSGKAQEVEISGSRKAVRTSGDVLAFVTPVASLTTVLVGNSGLCDCLVCRMEPDVCQKARLVGRCGGSRSRSRKRLHFYPSVCHEA